MAFKYLTFLKNMFLSEYIYIYIYMNIIYIYFPPTPVDYFSHIGKLGKNKTIMTDKYCRFGGFLNVEK